MSQYRKRNLQCTALGSALISALSALPINAAEFTANDKMEEVLVTGKNEGLLQERNVTASKMDLSIKDTGRSITQLGVQQIEDLAIENVRQAFEYVAGFRGNGSADRTYIARGVGTSIDNVMVDGLRSLQGGEGGTGSRLPSTFNAESATFLRGPAGLLYGSGVGGGLVNITTKRPSRESNTSIGISNRSYVTEGSNFDRNKTALKLDSTGAISSDDLLYRVIAQYTPSGEHFQEGRSIDETLLDAALTFSLGDHTQITPRVEYTERERTGGSGYADGVFESNFASGTITNYGKPINRSFYYGSPNDKGDNESRSFSLLLEHEFNEEWDLTLRGRTSKTKSDSIDLYISDSSDLGNSIGKDAIERKWVHAKGDDKYSLFDGSLQGKFNTGDIAHHVILGANFRDMDVKFAREFQQNADAVGKNTISASNPRQQIVGPVPTELIDVEFTPRNNKDTNVYFKDRVNFGAVTFVGGAAYVKQEQTSEINGSTNTGSYSDTIWDLGAIYALNDDINVFATYSRSFEPISARYIAQYGQGKSDYKPVEGDNYELGIKGEFLGKRLSTALTAFRLDRTNSTKFERRDGVWHLLQLEGTSFRSEGIELDASLSLSSNWMSSLSYAFTRAYDTIGDAQNRQANNTPKHSAAIWNHYQLSGDLEDFRLGFGLRYEGDRYDSNFVIKSYLEADAGIYYETKQWDAALVARNLFDKNRVEAGAGWITVQPNDPRSLTVSLKYHF